MLVELRARNYGWLTYARSPNEPEDVTFFERARGRNIAVYASAAKLAQRGRFFSEDDDESYDVLHTRSRRALRSRTVRRRRPRLAARARQGGGG